MPFTPLHMGPALLLKAVVPHRFSLCLFGWSQILIDIQPLAVMLGAPGPLHGSSHTLIGASVIALAATLTGKPLAQWGLARIGQPTRLSWRLALTSALIGSYSHLVLDALMHADLRPWLPFTAANPLWGLLSFDQIHLLCLLPAGLAVVVWLGQKLVGRWPVQPSE